MELKNLKRETLRRLKNEGLDLALAHLRTELDPDHPSYPRVQRLWEQNTRLAERIRQGTVREADIRREEGRIGGAIQDIAYELEEKAKEAEASKKKKFVFKFRDLEGNNAAEDGKEEPRQVVSFGYRGEPDYPAGMAAKRADMQLLKSYKAAYHAVIQGLKAADVDIEKGDREGGRVAGEIKPTGSARFGERIVVYLRPEQRGTTDVTVIVDSQDPKAVFDLGRNQQKLTLIQRAIREV